MNYDLYFTLCTMLILIATGRRFALIAGFVKKILHVCMQPEGPW